jgi:AcrR family transcriptional regulator
MSSPHRPPTWAANSDLTAKARIRNAAFELHAAQGEPNTTLREVALAAGVTHGLVVHHFANKEGLRRAVQQHMVDLLRQTLDDVPTEGSAAEIGRARDAGVARMYAEQPFYLDYLRRSLIDANQLDTELLDLLADFTLAQVRDLR